MNIDSELLTQVLGLPLAQRADLAHRLLLSLEPEAETKAFDEGWAASWAVEIERRMLSYDRGETRSIPWREAMEMVRKSIEPGGLIRGTSPER